MNPILQNYIKRYIDKDNKTQNANFPKFFTQYDLSNYEQFLPYLFEIEGFCLRLLEALICGDRICIYSDYDTDAMTATGVMYWGLVDLGFEQDKLSFYAPDRFVEGYGMNTEAVAKLILENDLIISVDCGINSVLEAQIVLKNLENQTTRKKLEKNSEKKCELIITDHHHLSDQVPDCVAVINPRLSEYWTNPKNAEKFAKIQNKLQIQSQKIAKIITNSGLENTSQKIAKIQKWLAKMNKKLDFQDLISENSQNSTQNSNYLSSSTTGVGVAWFSLVWFGYFLKELE